jgi:hypothetical protein
MWKLSRETGFLLVLAMTTLNTNIMAQETSSLSRDSFDNTDFRNQEDESDFVVYNFDHEENFFKIKAKDDVVIHGSYFSRASSHGAIDVLKEAENDQVQSSTTFQEMETTPEAELEQISTTEIELDGTTSIISDSHSTTATGGSSSNYTRHHPDESGTQTLAATKSKPENELTSTAVFTTNSHDMPTDIHFNKSSVFIASATMAPDQTSFYPPAESSRTFFTTSTVTSTKQLEAPTDSTTEPDLAGDTRPWISSVGSKMSGYEYAPMFHTAGYVCCFTPSRTSVVLQSIKAD